MSSAQQYDTDIDALRAHFSRELRRLREHASLSRNRLAEALGCSPQWIYKLEKTDKTVSEQVAYDLDTYFKTEGWERDDGLFHRIYEDLRSSGRRRVLLPGFDAYVRYEARAVGIRCFAPQVVPGLLQIEYYMRGLMDPAAPGETLEARVAGRLERQTILTRDKPPIARFVLDESVLRRPVGGPKVMVDQVDHLIGLAQSPRIQVRIMPFDRVTPAALVGNLILLSFERESDLMYTEASDVGQLTGSKEMVSKAGVDFETIMGEALSRGESLDLLSRAREAYL
ncbi:helix-turn-helix domain-containing protein [Actinoallomurus soli]|uniref:helix-turn-helix domain-containing protein n=1 Tax=Actinoallomurus soli TaxID=2952535 RepID=UPI002092DD1F|nr:helix-turn-helix transcriptional regulator [Actinoallomurus soli]MCO5970580.1 helix-turn-helix domain-containing protein [Actinoallomurus soli]